ncbi:caspase recruitment domain-containing protein 6 [Phyllostomus hastatus]|uniref:caspase recruitment domain-containing protein 6 n=1 Tax=Phyllostomus hastatus TaxID=9423 RepID=UPI001E682A93|nr:caspase recruitment domain-containing protein 6 [Phyllostomus hastatus]
MEELRIPVPGLEKTPAMATPSAPSEIIERERKRLLEILQQDLDSVLDSLTSRRLISEDEYETLEDMRDPLKKSRKLLILVQKKGEASCQHFLQCLLSTFPESATTTWGLSWHECLKHEDIEPLQSMGTSETSEEPLSPGEKQPGDSEPAVPFAEKERLGLEPSETETFEDKKTSYGETAGPSGAGAEEGHTPAAPLPRSVEDVEYEVSEAVNYLQDGQRYDEIDDSLYLGEEDCLESGMCSGDAASAVEEEDPSAPEYLVYDGEEDSAYSDTTELSGEEQSPGESDTGLPLEQEEEEAEEEERMEERKKVFKDVLSCLNLDRSRKLSPDAVRQFSLDRGCKWTPETPADLAWNFLVRVQALEVAAPESILRHDAVSEESRGEWPAGVGGDTAIRDVGAPNPLDMLCASLLCSDGALQRQVLASMRRCQFALPLLLPDAENNRSILMLGAMRDVAKQQPARALGGPAGDTEAFLARVKMPVISFVRLGDCSISKSRILNALLSPAHLEPRHVFLHRDEAAPGPPRRISDGLVEIAWCFPDGDRPQEDAPFPQEPVALANLRGDVERFWVQFGFLMEVSSAVFFFTDCLGEKEWDLLLFLGEAAMERCYFVLSPQARESEEAQIFQTILKLRPSQLLFWEEEAAGETGGNIQRLHTALGDVMSSSLQRVSVEDMGSLARELGIQVDQDLEDADGVPVPPSESCAGAAEDEGTQGHRQPESSSESTAELPAKGFGAAGEGSPAPANIHLGPGVRPHLWNSCFFPINRVPFRAPWVMGSHFGAGQKSKWFHPSPFQSSWAHGQGRSFGVQHFQPPRFCPGGRFMRFSRFPRKHHVHGLFGRPLRPVSPHVQAWPRRPQTLGACERPAVMAPWIRHPHPLGARPTGPFGKPQPRQAHPQAAQPTEATGKPMRTTSHTVNAHSQACRPAGVIQRPIRPAFQQGFKPKTQGGPLNPAVQKGSHPMSNNTFLPNSLFGQPKPSQYQHPQPKPSQPTSSQPKPTHTKPTQPQPSQAKSSPSKPTQPQPSQAKSSPSKPTQPQPRKPQASQSRPQPRSTQPKSSQASHSQAKTSYSRAGPKRGGKP